MPTHVAAHCYVFHNRFLYLLYAMCHISRATHGPEKKEKIYDYACGGMPPCASALISVLVWAMCHLFPYLFGQVSPASTCIDIDVLICLSDVWAGEAGPNCGREVVPNWARETGPGFRVSG